MSDELNSHLGEPVGEGMNGFSVAHVAILNRINLGFAVPPELVTFMTEHFPASSHTMKAVAEWGKIQLGDSNIPPDIRTEYAKKTLEAIAQDTKPESGYFFDWQTKVYQAFLEYLDR